MRVLLIFCLSGLLLCACSEDDNWYSKTIAQAERADLAQSVRNGVSYHYQGTVAEQFHIKEALSLDSSNGDFWREMGTARVKRGLAVEMFYYYAEAAQRKPDPWMGFRGYLYLYFYRDYPRAIADFNTLDSITGVIGNSQAQDHDYMRGIAYYGLKEYGSAKEYLEKYINRIRAEAGAEWVDVYAHLYLSFCHEQLEDYTALQKELNNCLELYPDLADAHFLQARLYFQQAYYSQARKSLEKAQKSYAIGFYHNRPYVEVLEQLYPEDFKAMDRLLTSLGA